MFLEIAVRWMMSVLKRVFLHILKLLSMVLVHISLLPFALLNYHGLIILSSPTLAL